MTKLIQSLSVKRKILYTVAASCVLIFGLIALASGEIGTGPVFSNVTPASGTNVTIPNPAISFVATDPDKINQSSIQVMVNGSILPVRVNFAEIGHYEEWWDSCSGTSYSQWIVDGYDYTKATVTVTTTSLPDNNSVDISVSDQLGNNSTIQWNFTAMIKPQITVISPVNGYNSGPKPVISAQITDNGGIDPQSIILKIGTQQVSPTYNSSTRSITYTPVSPLPAGRNDIYLEAKDLAGNQSITTWYINVSSDTAGPVLTGFSPAAGIDVKSSSAQISFTASDSSKIDTNSVQVKVNGRIVTAGVTLASAGRWVQYWDSCSGTYYETWVVDSTDPTKATITANASNVADVNTVSVSVKDQIGNISTSEWQFNANLPPIISEMTPGNGKYTSETLPKISAKVTDLGTIDPKSIVMKLNGTVVPHQYTSINTSSGTVSYIPLTPLPVGTQAVTLEVKDTAGNICTASWSFNLVVGNAAFSGETPAVGSTVYANSATVRVNVSDVADLTQGTLSVTVNGKPVTASIVFNSYGHYVTGYDSCTGEPYQYWAIDGYDYKNGSITAQASGLPDGKIIVSVRIANVTGVATSKVWTFDVNVPPSLSQPTPAANSTVQILTPLISAKVTDNGSIASFKMTVNGAEVPATIDAASGSINYTPAAPLANDTDYNVVITVQDNIGAAANLTWNFHTQIYADMQATGPCTKCHLGFPAPNHPMTNCYGCHSGGPIGDCADCHGGGVHPADYISWYDCNYCHNATYSYKIPLHPTDVTAYHNTTTNMEGCNQCHQSSLTAEHGRHQDAAGYPLTCYTCHSSGKPAVQQALTQKLKNCDACHGSINHESVHANSVLDDKCTKCHINSLTQEHLTNKETQATTLNCDTCHKNTKRTVSEAIYSLNKNCAACHKEGHNIMFGELAPLDVPLYEGFKWTSPGDAKLWSGESWVTAEYLDRGKVVMSNRRSDVTAAQVWSYYSDNMAADGWTLTSNAPVDGVDTFTVTFTKESRKMVLWFHKGETPGDNQTSGDGYRITIVYK